MPPPISMWSPKSRQLGTASWSSPPIMTASSFDGIRLPVPQTVASSLVADFFSGNRTRVVTNRIPMHLTFGPDFAYRVSVAIRTRMV